MERANWILLAQGAEARVYLAKNFMPDEEFSIIKERFDKKYRHVELEAKLSKQRFNGEVRGMVKAAKAGIDIPRLDFVDKEAKLLVMEFISGITTKTCFDNSSISVDEKIKIARLIGETVAQMHDAGLCHGDLTTSNLMIRNGVSDHLTVIDFGLSFSTKSAEDMGVDLYVLQRAFISTHPNSEEIFEQVLDAYLLKCKIGKKVKTHFAEIQQRGRKKIAFG